MSMSRKVILTVICMVLLSFLSVHLLSELIFHSSFLKIEGQNIENDVYRVIKVLSRELENLNISTQDWANWDETYQFAIDGNKGYIERNLADQIFENAKLNLFAVIDLDHNIVYKKAYDLCNHTEVVFPDAIEKYLSSSIIVHHSEILPNTTGFLIDSDTIFLISAYPILTSSIEGPSTGTLVFGNIMDASFIERLSDTTQSVISVWKRNDSQIPEDIQQAQEYLRQDGGVHVEFLDSDYVAGYTQIKDLFGNPAIIIKLTAFREISKQGRMAILFLFVTVGLISLLFGALFIYRLRNLVLTRLSTISDNIGTIGKIGDMTTRIHISGKDELTDLADNINTMLDKLDTATTELSSKKTLLDRILAFSPSIIIVIDEQVKIKLVNKAFCELFKTTEDIATGKDLREFVPSEKIYEIYKQIEATGAFSLNLDLILQINGIDRTFDLTIITMTSSEYLLIARDVTEENEVEERLYLNDRLASIGEMAAGVAHELNNPLTGIVMLSQSLMQADVPDDIKRDMADINSEANRASDVVRDLLAFARKRPPSKHLTQINSIIKDVIKLRQYELTVNNIEVDTILDQNLPEILVDSIQIQQVFLNLVLNAEYSMIQTHKQGRFQIQSYKFDGRVIVSFNDNGEGIKEDDLKKLFQPFFTTKEVGIGTGLGLSLCYGIVNRHGGSIYARSKWGHGATFTVELPLQESDTNGSGNGS